MHRLVLLNFLSSECSHYEIEMFHRILIANRGEIACRIIRTARAMGIKTVAVFSDIDANTLHVAMADQAIPIGGAQATESYLNISKIIAAAKRSKSEAIHPGYGFLSENPDFCDAVKAQGLIFIGPGAEEMRSMGLKDAAKTLMAEAGVPVVPGYQGSNQETKYLMKEAQKIGYPIFIKARAGGGGKGIRRVAHKKDFPEALASTKREAASSFGDNTVLIEKYIDHPRHIEIQIFADHHGNVVHLFERDCSLQRRHQKVIEESPASGMDNATRKAMTDASIAVVKAINYRGAGTVEFIVDAKKGLHPDRFWFMEMNTRLQVEHTVTEMITGVDLVEWQLRIAAGETLPLKQNEIQISGHSLETRLYAEDTSNNFLPTPGTITLAKFPKNSRVDSGISSGDVVSAFYDPMIAKIISHGHDRNDAFKKLSIHLGATHVLGITTNLAFLQKLCCNSDVLSGKIDTDWIDRNNDDTTRPHEINDKVVAIVSIIALRLDFSSPYFGWRHWGDGKMAISLNYQGKEYRRSVHIQKDNHVSVYHGDTQITFNFIKGSPQTDHYQFSFASTGEKVDIPFSTIAGQLAITYAGFFYRFHLIDALMAKENTIMSNTITAPMTGIIRQMNVKVGSRVKKGYPLICMEAMKMEHTLTAPRDGVIETLIGSIGSTVEDGTILITLKEEDQ